MIREQLEVGGDPNGRVDGPASERAAVERLLSSEPPASYLAAHLAREDERMFDGVQDKDVRRSLRVGEVPMPLLAPDEVLLAVMASAINYNTVWSATFEPIPTFRFLERAGPPGQVGGPARSAPPRGRIGRCGDRGEGGGHGPGIGRPAIGPSCTRA